MLFELVKKIKNYRKGFTLVELLVVIAIIGILSTVLILQLGSARAKARNIKRNSDVKQLVTAFNAAASNTGIFPDTSGAWVCVSVSCYGDWTEYNIHNNTVDSFLAPYLPQAPVDPTDSKRGYGGYLYGNRIDSFVGEDGVYPAGAYLSWTVEAPLGPNICGPTGRVYTWTDNFVTCFFKLD